MDKLLRSKYSIFDLTFMNDFGYGITCVPYISRQWDTNKFVYRCDGKEIILFDSNEGAVNIHKFLEWNKLNELDKNIVKRRNLRNFIHRYNSTAISNDEKRDNIDIVIYDRVDINYIASQAAKCTKVLKISNMTGRLMSLAGPLFEHCNAEQIVLKNINLDREGFESIKSEKLVLHQDIHSNPDIGYCRCKDLEMKHTHDHDFPLFPVSLVKLNIAAICNDLCVVGILPDLEILSLITDSRAVLYETPKLRELTLRAEELRYQSDLLDGITTFTGYGNGEMSMSLATKMKNIKSYTSWSYFGAMNLVGLKYLHVEKLYIDVDKLPDSLEVLLVDDASSYKLYNIPDILKARPTIRKITVNDSVKPEDYPEVEFQEPGLTTVIGFPKRKSRL